MLVAMESSSRPTTSMEATCELPLSPFHLAQMILCGEWAKHIGCIGAVHAVHLDAAGRHKPEDLVSIEGTAALGEAISNSCEPLSSISTSEVLI